MERGTFLWNFYGKHFSGTFTWNLCGMWELLCDFAEPGATPKPSEAWMARPQGVGEKEPSRYGILTCPNIARVGQVRRQRITLEMGQRTKERHWTICFEFPRRSETQFFVLGINREHVWDIHKNQVSRWLLRHQLGKLPRSRSPEIEKTSVLSLWQGKQHAKMLSQGVFCQKLPAWGQCRQCLSPLAQIACQQASLGPLRRKVLSFALLHAEDLGLSVSRFPKEFQKHVAKLGSLWCAMKFQKLLAAMALWILLAARHGWKAINNMKPTPCTHFPPQCRLERHHLPLQKV